MGNRVEGRRKSERLVLPYVWSSVGCEVVEDLEVEGLKFFWGSGRSGEGGVGEDGIENGVVWRAGVFEGENGRRG